MILVYFNIFHLILVQNLVLSEITQQINTKLYGGRTSEKIERAHFVGLHYEQEHICGASIIHTEKLLTAAHCFYKTLFEKLSVEDLSLEYNDVKFAVKDYRTHPLYFHYQPQAGNDVAVIFLPSNISDYIESYKIMGLAKVRPSIGTKCFTIGAGVVDPYNNVEPIPKYTELDIVSWDYCAQFSRLIVNNKICTGPPKDGVPTQVCPGDSGGGLIENDTIVGIVSYGPVATCGIARNVVFTDVALYRKWIETVDSGSTKTQLDTKILIFILIVILHWFIRTH